jgi:hypothetical protein
MSNTEKPPTTAPSSQINTNGKSKSRASNKNAAASDLTAGEQLVSALKSAKESNVTRQTSPIKKQAKVNDLKIARDVENSVKKKKSVVKQSEIFSENSSPERPFISIIIPVKNESKSLKALIAALKVAHTAGAEVIIIDDASTDKTPEILAREKFIKVHSRTQSKGFGAAVKSGFEIANGKYIAWLPGNLRVLPLYAVAMAYELENRAPNQDAFAKAHRGNRPKNEQITTFLAGVLLTVRAGTMMMETGGTPTVIPRSALPYLKNAPDDLGLESYTLWKLPKVGFRPLRLATPFGERRFGQSHWNKGYKAKFKLLLNLLQTVRTYR